MKRGDTLGPLFGVPFSVKDLVNTAGARTTFGSVALADNVPSADAVAVARLKRAGAILIGKPSVLASALQRITGDIARIPSRDLRRVETMNAFFFTPAVSGQSLAGLLSTHPTLEKRLAQLAELEREMGRTA